MTKKEKQFIEEMKRCRNIDFAQLGMMIEVNGSIGTIVGMNPSANLNVVFANQQKYGKHAHNCHPTWETRYFGSNGKVIADYRTKANQSSGKPFKQVKEGGTDDEQTN